MKFVRGERDGERDLKYEVRLFSQHAKAVTGGLHDIIVLRATPNRLTI